MADNRPNSVTTAPAGTDKVGAIVVAAGESKRMGGPNKVFMELLGKPLICYAVEALRQAPQIGPIALVLSRGGLEEGRRLCESESWRDVTLCVGGARRQDSVRNGLDALVECDWVIVHDGARPAMDASLIERGLSMAKQHGAAIAAVPVKDTIKAVNGSMLVEKTLPREQLWAVQTPQIFARDVLMRAHNEVSHDVTDDAAMVEAIGLPVAIFHGDYENIKVTTAEDVHLAESILRRRRAAARPT